MSHPLDAAMLAAVSMVGRVRGGGGIPPRRTLAQKAEANGRDNGRAKRPRTVPTVFVGDDEAAAAWLRGYDQEVPRG